MVPLRRRREPPPQALVRRTSPGRRAGRGRGHVRGRRPGRHDSRHDRRAPAGRADPRRHGGTGEAVHFDQRGMSPCRRIAHARVLGQPRGGAPGTGRGAPAGGPRGRRTDRRRGCGPAGIEVARVLAENGLDVVVLEQDDSVGGRIGYALLADPHQVREYRRWAERSLSEHGVEVRLGTRATPSVLAGLTPERVVFAGGSPPTLPRWLGSARYEVRTDADYLAGAWEPTHDSNVAVYDPERYSAGSVIALRLAKDTDRRVGRQGARWRHRTGSGPPRGSSAPPCVCCPTPS
ncbi:FAD-dependent oxidoreductase [Streptomyces sp. RTd22]|uniref:FAD-dependent oxidoreductase n=1 Tax=Streptomyces sp. RTd22 TaxID=1841249 RepID=UPI000D1BC3EC|nr:FAD/NAD(P)-binding oxidoreductase [Streptomyces sp. RTd22]